MRKHIFLYVIVFTYLALSNVSVFAEPKPSSDSFSNSEQFGHYLKTKVAGSEVVSELKRIANPKIFPVKALADLFGRGLAPPKQVDKLTTLTAINSKPPSTVVMHYSLALDSKSIADDPKLDWSHARPQLVKHLCGENVFGPWFKRGFDTLSIYTAADGVVAQQIPVTQEDCKETNLDPTWEQIQSLSPEVLKKVADTWQSSPALSKNERISIGKSFSRLVSALENSSVEERELYRSLYLDILGGKISHYLIAVTIIRVMLPKSSIPKSDQEEMVKQMTRFIEGLRQDKITVEEAREIFGQRVELNDQSLRRVSGEAGILAGISGVDDKFFTVDIAGYVAGDVDRAVSKAIKSSQ